MKKILSFLTLAGLSIKIERAKNEFNYNNFTICKYFYPEKPGDGEINCNANDNHFIIEIIDSGIPFDITSLSDPDVTADVDERKISDLGVFLIKKLKDEVRYRRENNRNILNLIIKKDK